MAPRPGLPTASVTGGSSLKFKEGIIVLRHISLAKIQAAKAAWNAVRTNAHATAAQKKVALQAYKAVARDVAKELAARKRLG